MKNVFKTILIIILLLLISFVGYKIYESKKEEKVEEKLIVNENTILVDLGDLLLLVNDNKITNALYYNFDGCYLLGDKLIISEDLESITTITEILNSYNKLLEITIYDESGIESAQIDSILETKDYNVERVIYPSLITLEEKISKLNIFSNISGLSKIELVTLLYEHSNKIKNEVNNELEIENMTHLDMRKYMIREIDEIKLLLEDGKEYKVTKKMGKIDGNNRIYYCYEDDRCFIYDYVNNNKKKIFLDEKLMKLNYSYYIDYEVTYSTSIIDGNLMCQKEDESWLLVNGYVSGTNLEYYKEYLECIIKK